MKKLIIILSSVIGVSLVLLAGALVGSSYVNTKDGIKYKLLEDGTYEVVGVRKTNINEAVIADTYKKKPVTSIRSFAFSKCSSLTSVLIPEGVTTISDGAFSNCSSLATVSIPDTVTMIGYEAFSGCNSLTSISIPDGITYFGLGAVPYSLCTVYENGYYIGNEKNPYLVLTSVSNDRVNYTSFEIPDGCKIISSLACDGCTELTTLTVPKSVRSFGNDALGCTHNLTSIIYEGTTSEWNAIQFEDFWNRASGNYTVHCTDGDLEKNF